MLRFLKGRNKNKKFKNGKFGIYFEMIGIFEVKRNEFLIE